jgi:HEAT repeat protein
MNCPTCGNPLDPLRAPVAKVIGGKIVTFCSPGCAAGQSQKMAVPAAAAAAAEAPRRAKSFTGGGSTAPEKKLPPALIVDDEPDEDESPRVPDLRRGRNRRILWMTAALLAGGAAIVVIQAVSPSSPGPVSAERDGDGAGNGTAGRDVPVEAPPDGPAALDVRDPDAVRGFATAELAAMVAAAPAGRVPRITREAARALSRTGDKAALDVLARALAGEDSEITQVEVAYALARGGDARGAKALVAVLKSDRRDVRADAARALVQLGDERGVPVLENLLGVSQFRLGAAEALAPLGVPRALQVLEGVRKDARASREDQLRATVALGRAGRAEVAADLRAVLGDRQFNVGAAEALARLRDPAAAPVLGEQLAVPSLQVGAALGLRRLDPELDPAPYLPGLVATMNSGKDTAKVSAAEAILVLTGPAEIAERD